MLIIIQLYSSCEKRTKDVSFVLESCSCCAKKFGRVSARERVYVCVCHNLKQFFQFQYSLLIKPIGYSFFFNSFWVYGYILKTLFTLLIVLSCSQVGAESFTKGSPCCNYIIHLVGPKSVVLVSGQGGTFDVLLQHYVQHKEPWSIHTILNRQTFKIKHCARSKTSILASNAW